MSDFLVIFKSKCDVIDKSQNKYSIPIKAEMRPNLYMFNSYFPCYIENIENINGEIAPGESSIINIRAIMTEKAAKDISINTLFELRAIPNTIAHGCVISIIDVVELP